MGHLAGKDVYRRLGRKIDGLPTRGPWNATLRSILEKLYTTEEAELVVRMPYGLSTLDRVARLTGYEKARLRTLLDGLCSKGLVMDVHVGGEYRYTVSPVVIGIFEFTMMRTDGEVDHAALAGLFHEYLFTSGALFRGNYGHGEQIGIMRALPHDGTVRNGGYVEVLDYEKAAAIVEGADRLCVGICSCRHISKRIRGGSKRCPGSIRCPIRAYRNT